MNSRTSLKAPCDTAATLVNSRRPDLQIVTNATAETAPFILSGTSIFVGNPKRKLPKH